MSALYRSYQFVSKQLQTTKYMADRKDSPAAMIRTEGERLLTLGQSGRLTRRGLDLATALSNSSQGTVLIVESDGVLAQMMRLLFRSLTKCVWFQQMDQARSYFRQHASEIRLIVGQQNQTGTMSEFFASCHKLNPELRCIVTFDGGVPPSAWAPSQGQVRILPKYNDRMWQLPDFAEEVQWAWLGLALPLADIFQNVLSHELRYDDAVAVVSDDTDLRERLRREHVGEYHAYSCIPASNAWEAQQLLRTPSLEICLMIITDFQSEGSGCASDLLRRVRSQQDDLRILSLSDRGALQSAQLLDDPIAVELPKNATRGMIHDTLWYRFWHHLSLEGENSSWVVI